MKKLIFSILTVFFLISCKKNEEIKTVEPHPTFDAKSFVQSINDQIAEAEKQLPSVSESEMITMAEVKQLQKLEDQYLDMIPDKVIEDCLVINRIDPMQKYLMIKQYIPNNRAYESTLETYMVRNAQYQMFDSNPEIIAQVLSNYGQYVGTYSSLNLYRTQNDNGLITYHDVARAFLGNAQASYDQVIEYLPESVVFQFEVSGGNWLIDADVVFDDPADLFPADTIHYGMDSPNGPLIWNPTLNSPADDDVIQGPLPYNVLSISSNGLIPPSPID